MSKKIKNILTMIQSSQYEQAADALLQCNKEEITAMLQNLNSNNFQVNSISLLRRKLKPGFSYKDFYNAWLPPIPASQITHTDQGIQASYFPFPVRIINGFNAENSNEIISIGLMAATESDIQELQYDKELLKTEAMRHDQIKKISRKVGSTLFFSCNDDNNLGL